MTKGIQHIAIYNINRQLTVRNKTSYLFLNSYRSIRFLAS